MISTLHFSLSLPSNCSKSIEEIRLEYCVLPIGFLLFGVFYMLDDGCWMLIEVIEQANNRNAKYNRIRLLPHPLHPSLSSQHNLHLPPHPLPRRFPPRRLPQRLYARAHRRRYPHERLHLRLHRRLDLILLLQR